jgi:threonine synthase
VEYYSTNVRSQRVAFREAALMGLADDGGLFMPATIPELPAAFWRDCGALTFAEVTEEVGAVFLDGDVPRPVLRAIVRDALTFDVPLVELAPGRHILELFHGPTLAFKDFGARFMARVFAHLREAATPDTPDLTVLVATSGDTGSAVAQGFHGVPGTRVVLLYPSGKVSRIQEQQLTTLGGNITALEVRGTFDDCQRMVKAAFRDPALQARLALTSANSINIARLIPQTFYYAYAYAQLRDKATPPVFAVPSGNFGNLTAGVLAQRMGMPCAGFVAATNANDVVPVYLASGRFTPRPSRQTRSSAMDVGDPSNFARLLALYGGDRARMARDIHGYSASDEDTLAAMRELYDRYGYVADPHTAVGYRGLLGYLSDVGDTGRRQQGIVLATAHPAKFAEICREALGIEVELPERLRACLAQPKQKITIPAEDEALRAFLLRDSA